MAKAKKPPDLCERAYAYSLRAVKLYQALQRHKDGAALIIGEQYLRQATAVGALLELAAASLTRAEIANHHAAARQQARASLYWLHVLAASGLVESSRLAAITQETEEIVALLEKTTGAKK
jgi:four helix bundle protein